ncbi:hypothetical protein ACFL1M_02960 [Patescibacteria group bacterium]
MARKAKKKSFLSKIPKKQRGKIIFFGITIIGIVAALAVFALGGEIRGSAALYSSINGKRSGSKIYSKVNKDDDKQSRSTITCTWQTCIKDPNHQILESYPPQCQTDTCRVTMPLDKPVCMTNGEEICSNDLPEDQSDCSFVSKQLSSVYPLSTKSQLYANWGGVSEKWFIDKSGAWYYIYPNPTKTNPNNHTINKWTSGLARNNSNNIGKDKRIMNLQNSSCYDQVSINYSFPDGSNLPDGHHNTGSAQKCTKVYQWFFNNSPVSGAICSLSDTPTCKVGSLSNKVGWYSNNDTGKKDKLIVYDNCLSTTPEPTSSPNCSSDADCPSGQACRSVPWGGCPEGTDCATAPMCIPYPEDGEACLDCQSDCRDFAGFFTKFLSKIGIGENYLSGKCRVACEEKGACPTY